MDPHLDPGLVRGATMVTYTGRRFDIAEPHPEQVDIIDIAHALAMTCRFNGAVLLFYSVAEHSVFASELCTADPLGALLHDATEAYVGDLIRPMKRLFRSEGVDLFDRIEERIWRAIATRFGVAQELHPSVKEVDDRLCATEQRQLVRMPTGWTPAVLPFPITLKAWDPPAAERKFLERFEALTSQGGA